MKLFPHLVLILRKLNVLHIHEVHKMPNYAYRYIDRKKSTLYWYIDISMTISRFLYSKAAKHANPNYIYASVSFYKYTCTFAIKVMVV